MISVLYENLFAITWQQCVMWLIGGILIYLAIKKEMEPSLLLPMGFGAILVNLPNSGAITQAIAESVGEEGVVSILFKSGIANELFPLLLFVGIGAMIDFGPLLANPRLMLFGAAAQFGIFFTFSMARLFGFSIEDAASIGIIGAADGPTSIFVANVLKSNYLGAIVVAAYSYMALVPIVQPPIIKLITTKNERLIKMPYAKDGVSKTTKILFPIIITIIVGIVSPKSVALIGSLCSAILSESAACLTASRRRRRRFSQTSSRFSSVSLSQRECRRPNSSIPRRSLYSVSDLSHLFSIPSAELCSASFLTSSSSRRLTP